MQERRQDGWALSGAPIIRFGKFELDARSGELRSRGLRIRLQEQPLQVLLMLLEHPGEVVSRQQIRQRLWPDGTFVDFEHSINAAIKRLRDALGESVTRQRYLQTLPRRGYRFVGEIGRTPVRIQAVGRAKERAQLLAGLASASAGHGHLLCVSGETGIGKTTLVEQFLDEATAAHSYHVGRARCSERLAGTGAWLPWLETLDSLLAGALYTGHNSAPG
jgi:DNA-binding winged helix-turn-helix (wHTH) protein